MIIETNKLKKKDRTLYNDYLKKALTAKDTAAEMIDKLMYGLQAYYKEIYTEKTGQAPDQKEITVDDFIAAISDSEKADKAQAFFENQLAAIDLSYFYDNLINADNLTKKTLQRHCKKYKNETQILIAAQKVLDAITLDDLKLYIHLYITFTTPIGLVSHFTFIKHFLQCYDLEAYNVRELEEKGELLSNARSYIYYNDTEKGHSHDYGEDAPYIITDVKDFETVLIFLMGAVQNLVTAVFLSQLPNFQRAALELLQLCYKKAAEFCPPPDETPKAPNLSFYLLDKWRRQCENYMLDMAVFPEIADKLEQQFTGEQPADDTPNTEQTEPQPKEELKSITPRMPKKFISISDKVSDKAFSEAIGEPLAVRVSRKDGKKQITTLLNLELYDETSIVGLDRLTPYDRTVHDAIVTVCIEGGGGDPQMYMTPQTIYRTMTGNFNVNPSKEAIDRINKSLRRLGGIRITINADDEMKTFYKMPEGFQYEGAIVPNEMIRFKSNGIEVEGIHLLRTPILYNYASIKNQISQEDIKLLATPLNKSEENIILQDYLFRRVSAMKHSPKLSRNILYSTVYDNIQITAASPGALRKKRHKVRENIKVILDYWIKQGFIKAYRENYGAKNESLSLSIVL